MKTIVLITAISLAAGCSLLNPLANDAADKIASAVDIYCAEVDQVIRYDIRAKVNNKTENEIRIECISEEVVEPR